MRRFEAQALEHSLEQNLLLIVGGRIGPRQSQGLPSWRDRHRPPARAPADAPDRTRVRIPLFAISGNGSELRGSDSPIRSVSYQLGIIVCHWEAFRDS
jgi:hypothetical protein